MTYYQFNREEHGHQKFPLKRREVWKEVDIWSPDGTCHVAYMSPF
jgi:hypothetical protein